MRLARAGRLVAGLGATIAAATSFGSAAGQSGAADAAATARTTTPIKHVVVIFQENVSFDHYFGTYPKAANPPGEPRFAAAWNTPTVNGLGDALRVANPNLANPQRLSRAEALTCDQNHDYTAEQDAADHGAVDRFVESTSARNGDGTPKTRAQCVTPPRSTPTPGDLAVMDYYDGNTVTALWNYAQHFAMSDNSFGTSYGPSTPGALNLVAGNTYPALCAADAGSALSHGFDPSVYDGTGNVRPCPDGVSTLAAPGTSPGTGTGTVVSDPDPYFDACSNPKDTTALGGRNLGDLLSARGLSWGFFQGGFSSPGYVPGTPSSFDPSTICKGAHYNIGAGPGNDGKPCVRHTPALPVDAFCVTDYSAHHQPFSYYASTSNPRHLPPTAVASIGHSDQANHQYDLADFFAATDSGSLPAVSFLKAAKFQDGHAGYSDPLDEQHFLVSTINRLQRLPEWASTAVVIAYDDSDGWYDHALAPLLTESQTGLDSLTVPGQCGASPARVPTTASGAPEPGRCGLGPRLPLLVVSPYARSNAVDHALTDQSSILRFIEDNWGLGRLGNGSVDARAGSLAGLFDFSHARGQSARLTLDPATGEPRRDDG